VIAGSVNTSSPLYVQISQTGQQTRLAGIVRLLDQALAEKPRLAVAADRFASWFVALLLLAAAGSYIAWHFIEPARACGSWWRCWWCPAPAPCPWPRRQP
jgi:Cu2+-exporting ATPase